MKKFNQKLAHLIGLPVKIILGAEDFCAGVIIGLLIVLVLIIVVL